MPSLQRIVHMAIIIHVGVPQLASSDTEREGSGIGRHVEQQRDGTVDVLANISVAVPRHDRVCNGASDWVAAVHRFAVVAQDTDAHTSGAAVNGDAESGALHAHG